MTKAEKKNAQFWKSPAGFAWKQFLLTGLPEDAVQLVDAFAIQDAQAKKQIEQE